MNPVRTLARPLIAGSLVVSGVSRLRSSDETARHLAPVLKQVSRAAGPQVGAYLKDEKLVARVLAGSQVGSGVLLALGKMPRVAAGVLVATTALNTLVEYKKDSDVQSLDKDAKAHRTQNLLKNTSLLGALMLTSQDTHGRPGLAWRAEHLGESAKRHAYYVGQDLKNKAVDAQHSAVSAALQADKKAVAKLNRVSAKKTVKEARKAAKMAQKSDAAKALRKGLKDAQNSDAAKNLNKAVKQAQSSDFAKKAATAAKNLSQDAQKALNH